MNDAAEPDGLDYLLWAGRLGPPPSSGPEDDDYNGDGYVDGLDYITWAGGYYGSHHNPASPEPTTFGLLALGAVALAIGRRRHS